MTDRAAKAPRVGIGLPVYNGERFLRTALDSILAQTFTDFELLISDNGSTDATAAICEEYCARDPRIIYRRQPENRGGAWNFNFVLSASRGEFFKWATHDDYLAPTFLERCLQAHAEHPDIVLCYPQATIVDADGRNPIAYTDYFHLMSPSPVIRFKQVLFRPGSRLCNPIHGLIRRDALARTRKLGSYMSSDEILLAHLALLGKFYELPDRLFFRRAHPGTSVKANHTIRQRYLWFDPRIRGRILLPTLRHFYEYNRTIFGTGISASDKLACVLQVLKKTYWSRAQLLREARCTLNRT